MKNLFKFHNSTILKCCIFLIMISGLLLSCNQDDLNSNQSVQPDKVENRNIEPCVPPSSGLPCGIDEELWLINIPQFGSCGFLMNVERFICNGVPSYNFGEYEISFHDCPAFNTWIANCTASGSTYEACILTLQDQIREALVLKILSIENPPSPNLSLYFYQAACNQHCLIAKPDPKTGLNFTIIKKLRCSEACCVHEYEAAFSNGVWEILDSSAMQYGGIGCGGILQVETCSDYGAFYTSECINECE